MQLNSVFGWDLACLALTGPKFKTQTSCLAQSEMTLMTPAGLHFYVPITATERTAQLFHELSFTPLDE